MPHDWRWRRRIFEFSCGPEERVMPDARIREERSGRDGLADELAAMLRHARRRAASMDTARSALAASWIGRPGSCATSLLNRNRAGCGRVVERLASPEFGGRSGAGGEKTVLLPERTVPRAEARRRLFDGEYVQPIPGKEPGSVQGRNVGARLARLRRRAARRVGHRGRPFRSSGRPPGRSLSGCRRQCLGRRDDARGRTLGRREARPPRRSIMFIGFDLEEIGLFGSRYFVAHSPVPLDKVVLFITADMIGARWPGSANRTCLCWEPKTPRACVPGSPTRPRAGP